MKTQDNVYTLQDCSKRSGQVKGSLDCQQRRIAAMEKRGANAAQRD